MNRGKAEMEYSLDVDPFFQPITGSQIALVYGVSNPIQEAPSQEEITLRQIDSNIPKIHINRGDHRHFSQGFSNLSHMAQHRQKNNQSTTANNVKKDQSLVGGVDQISKQQMILLQLQEDQQYQDQQQIVTAHSLAHSTPIPNSQLDGQQDNTLDMLDFTRLHQLYKQNQINSQPKIAILHSPKLQLQLSPRIAISPETTTAKQQQFQEKAEKQEKVNASETNITIIPLQHPNSAQGISSPRDKDSLEMLCPFCAQHIFTKITFQPNCKTHMIAVGLGLVGFLCGLCLIPYYFPERFQTALHSCPICKKQISIKDF